jgi:pyroglutamyl-peptidase
MAILLTGFEPFDGESTNPSWEAVRGFAGQTINGQKLHTVQLPTEYVRAANLLRAQLIQVRPSLTLCVGQAGGRALISLEKVAINFAHAQITDNAGQSRVHDPIKADAPAAYFPNYDFADALARLGDANIPAELSLSAGAFVCNEVFYALCEYQAQHPSARGTFIHIPYAPEQVLSKPNAPAMPRAMVQRALLVLMKCAT